MNRFLPFGDQAVQAYFSDEREAQRFAASVRRARDPWLIDVVQAYTSVAVYFDLDQTCFTQVAEHLGNLDSAGIDNLVVGPLHAIPCCYELGLDHDRIRQHTGLSVNDIIRLHTETEYTVYAIGFCPGFPYLGYLPPPLCGVPKQDSPRLRVEAGSVGLTGRQTGIYTEVRPGGWNLVGRTPLELVSVKEGYFPLRTGDRVRFQRIDGAEFPKLQGERLPEVPVPKGIDNPT